MPCKKCGLQYSSYCVDCVYVKTGLNLYDTDFNKKSKCNGSFSNCYNCTLHWLESEAEE